MHKESRQVLRDCGIAVHIVLYDINIIFTVCNTITIIYYIHIYVLYSVYYIVYTFNSMLISTNLYFIKIHFKLLIIIK